MNAASRKMIPKAENTGEVVPAALPLRARGRFTPSDFASVIQHLPAGCPLAGGQAVAWWAARYDLADDDHEPITSSDVDFWGTREDLIKLGRSLKRKPVFPHEYEMTVWVGAIPIEIQGQRTVVEFLHSIPGLDVLNPEKASVEQEYRAGAVAKVIPILSPVSLVLAKLHALRHFSQKERQDELHLRVSLRAAQAFISELVTEGAIRHVLWNSERLLTAHQFKPYRRLEKQFDFIILEAVPIDTIRKASAAPGQSQENRDKLARFVEERWQRVVGRNKSRHQLRRTD